jgi:glycosyltransferase involved in cell wall biosynthesis
MSQPPLKVLFLTSSYPRSKEDTASIFLRYLGEHLADAGIAVHVLAPADVKGGTIREGKIVVHRFQYFPSAWQTLAYGSGIMPNLKRSPWLWLQIPFFLLAMFTALLRLLATERFDLIHAHWILPQGLLALLSASLFRVPWIITAHGTDAFALRSRVASYLKRLVIRRSSSWTTNTFITADAILRNSRLIEPRIIPMGVDITRFSNGNPVSLRGELPEGEFLVLFVGRLVANKGCIELLTALSLLPPTTLARTTLWIIGEGNQKTQLQQTASDLAVAKKVRFFGTVSNHRLPDLYAAADLVVVPSLQGSSGESEGQGIVILEAFAARVCVLASRIGGIANVIRDNITGVLVEPGNVQELANAMKQLLNDAGLRRRLADKAFAEVNERYSWQQIAGEFAKLYREVSLRTSD